MLTIVVVGVMCLLLGGSSGVCLGAYVFAKAPEPAPPPCKCGHQPWKHGQVHYPKGMALGSCNACDCGGYSALWREVGDGS